jgi:hypothetical protein
MRICRLRAAPIFARNEFAINWVLTQDLIGSNYFGSELNRQAANPLALVEFLSAWNQPVTPRIVCDEAGDP